MSTARWAEEHERWGIAVKLAALDAAKTCRHWTPEEIEASPYSDPAYQAALFEKANRGVSSEHTLTGAYFSI
jgi:hypothetical protein